jgi:hypothetical protein
MRHLRIIYRYNKTDSDSTILDQAVGRLLFTVDFIFMIIIRKAFEIKGFPVFLAR